MNAICSSEYFALPKYCTEPLFSHTSLLHAQNNEKRKIIENSNGLMR